MTSPECGWWQGENIVAGHVAGRRNSQSARALQVFRYEGSCRHRHSGVSGRGGPGRRRRWAKRVTGEGEAQARQRSSWHVESSQRHLRGPQWANLAPKRREVGVVVEAQSAAKVRTSRRTSPAAAARQTLPSAAGYCEEGRHGDCGWVCSRRRCQRGLLEAVVAGGGWARAARTQAAAEWQSAAELGRAVS